MQDSQELVLERKNRIQVEDQVHVQDQDQVCDGAMAFVGAVVL